MILKERKWHIYWLQHETGAMSFYKRTFVNLIWFSFCITSLKASSLNMHWCFECAVFTSKKMLCDKKSCFSIGSNRLWLIVSGVIFAATLMAAYARLKRGSMILWSVDMPFSYQDLGPVDTNSTTGHHDCHHCCTSTSIHVCILLHTTSRAHCFTSSPSCEI